MELPPNYINKFKKGTPRKDSNRQELICKLSEATGRTKKSIYFSFIGMPDTWLKDALSHCLHYTDIKARQAKLTEFLNNTKI